MLLVVACRCVLLCVIVCCLLCVVWVFDVSLLLVFLFLVWCLLFGVLLFVVMSVVWLLLFVVLVFGVCCGWLVFVAYWLLCVVC